MNSVPLIQKVDKDSINTTIIAIKKAINEIESALGLDSGSEIDTSVFVKKSEVVDAVEADNLNPVTSNAVADYTVDRIEVNNSQPVTSNAVYEGFGTWQRVLTIDSNSYVDGLITQNGKYLRIRFSGTWSGYLSNGTILFTLPNGWRPTVNPNRCVIGVDTPSVRMNAGLDIGSDGNVKIYFQGNTPMSGGETITGLFADALINLL